PPIFAPSPARPWSLLLSPKPCPFRKSCQNANSTGSRLCYRQVPGGRQSSVPSHQGANNPVPAPHPQRPALNPPRSVPPPTPHAHPSSPPRPRLRLHLRPLPTGTPSPIALKPASSQPASSSL
ncbi:hypothetical protein B0H14DRAFT_3890210, partial [Mycena olivaceomarginata]